jgi:hypothetical protein
LLRAVAKTPIEWCTPFATLDVGAGVNWRYAGHGGQQGQINAAAEGHDVRSEAKLGE